MEPNEVLADLRHRLDSIASDANYAYSQMNKARERLMNGHGAADCLQRAQDALDRITSLCEETTDELYRVTMTRIEYQKAVVEVGADNEEDAKEEAMCCDSDEFETENAEQHVESVEELNNALETYRKRGRHWEYLGVRSADTMRGAALMTGYVHHIKVIAVRPEDSRDKLYVFRFINTPFVTSGH